MSQEDHQHDVLALTVRAGLVGFLLAVSLMAVKDEPLWVAGLWLLIAASNGAHAVAIYRRLDRLNRKGVS